MADLGMRDPASNTSRVALLVSGGLIAAASVVLVLVLLQSGDETNPAHDRSALSRAEGLTFVATNVSISDDVEPIPRVTLHVERGQLSLQARCNILATMDAKMTNEALEVGSVNGTDKGCSLKWMNEDGWLVELVSSSPVIQFRDGKFAITSSQAGLQLAQTASP